MRLHVSRPLQWDKLERLAHVLIGTFHYRAIL